MKTRRQKRMEAADRLEQPIRGHKFDAYAGKHKDRVLDWDAIAVARKAEAKRLRAL